MAKKRLPADRVELLKESMLTFMQRGQYEEAFGCIGHLYEDDWRSTYKYVKAFRSAMKSVVGKGEADAAACYELLHQSYILTAPEKFDDFMIALEWYRPDADKFWLPRRKQLQFLADILEEFIYGDLDELFISMPPRVGKSTLVMFFLIWVVCKNPNGSNIYSSFTEMVVKTYYNGVLEVMQDPTTYDLPTIFPDFKLAATDSKDCLIDVGRRKRYKSITCRSVHGTLSGATDADSLLIADDLHSGVDEAKNKDILASTWATVRGNLLSRAKSGCKILWIGTHWSLYDCISNRLDMLLNEPDCANIKFKEVNIPALNESDESNFDYLFGKGFTSEDFRVIRSSYERSGDMQLWMAPYMGTPIESEGALFSPNDLRYFNGVLPEEVEPDKKFMAVDPAWGGGDYVAAPVIYQYDNDMYIVDVVYNKSDKSITQPMVARKAAEWGVGSMYVEATKVTSSYADGVSEKLKEYGYRLNMVTTTKHWGGQQGKTQRICDKAPDIRGFMIFLNAGQRSKEYEQFMQNLFSFSYVTKNKNDDAPDSLVMALLHTFSGSAKVQLRQRFF